MKVFPVRYKWHAEDMGEGIYYIVADSPTQAEEIAYGCVAANIYPTPEGPDRPPKEGRQVAKVWVLDHSAADTTSAESGLLGTGDPGFNARAYAAYLRQTGCMR